MLKPHWTRWGISWQKTDTKPSGKQCPLSMSTVCVTRYLFPPSQNLLRGAFTLATVLRTGAPLVGHHLLHCLTVRLQDYSIMVIFSDGSPVGFAVSGRQLGKSTTDNIDDVPRSAHFSATPLVSPTSLMRSSQHRERPTR